MRKAEVETEVPQKDDFEFEVARGDDPVVEAGNGNNTIFEVEVPEEEEEFDQSQLGNMIHAWTCPVICSRRSTC